MHTTFWLGVEQCINRRQNLAPDEFSPRFACHTYQKLAPEKWSRFVVVVSGVCDMDFTFTQYSVFVVFDINTLTLLLAVITVSVFACSAA